MLFGKIKMLITVLMIAGVAGAGIYVMKLRSDNAILKANQTKLETAITEQNKVLEQQKKDLQDLDKRFTKKNRDIGKLSIQRTDSMERIINKGGKNAARCIELASGAEHTEAELKATLKSQINPECPALANPNFVHYE